MDKIRVVLWDFWSDGVAAIGGIAFLASIINIFTNLMGWRVMGYLEVVQDSFLWSLFPLCIWAFVAWYRRRQSYLSLEQKLESVIAEQHPTFEILGLTQDTAEQNRPWLLQVHNKSPSIALSGCKAYLERMEVIEGSSSLASNLTLGTRNQWREHRAQGPFELAPDQTKELLICEPIQNPTFSFRLYWAQGQTMKMHQGKYRLHILVFAETGQAVRAQILIEGNSITLEAIQN